MHLADAAVIISPTDVAAFAACRQQTWLDQARARGMVQRERFEDPRLELLQQRGDEHEEAYLSRLEADGKRVRRFDALQKHEYRDRSAYRRRHKETLAAMCEGYDVIYQGCLFDEQHLGLVDFLTRVEHASDLGAWSYEVVDAKLAREAKAGAVIQACVYSEMLEDVQGVRPERLHLFLGGGSPRRVSYRLAHFAAYQRSLAGRMREHLENAPDALPIAPDPVDHCQVCDWRPRCRRERVQVDHLSLVADIRRDQRRALERDGIRTLEALAKRSPDEPGPEGIRSAGFHRIREQARVQYEGRCKGAPVHELLPIEESPSGPPLGLAALPSPHSGDLFFDFEGADYVGHEGLEYLWGISNVDDGYSGEWALTREDEKAALQRFLARAEAHVAEHPGAHIYHFGHYEPTALKSLVGRYGVGTDALDRLLKQRVFVDLHRIVRQSVRASVESYSLKALEAHFGFERSIPLEEANPARSRLEFSLASGLMGPESLTDRPIVEGYNRDDCVSTRALRDWLETLRADLEADSDGPIPRPRAPDLDDEDDDQRAVSAEVAELMEGLLRDVSEVREERSEEEHVRWLAAHLLEWHRREDKTAWWDYFRLRELSVDELVEETTPLAGLEYVDVVGAVKQSSIHRFTFPPQEHRLEAGKSAKVPAREEGEKDKTRQVWAIDDADGWIELKVGNRTEWNPEEVLVLLRDDIVQTNDQRVRLRESARRLLGGEDALGEWSPASLALLRADAPTFDGGVSLPDLVPGADLLDHARAAALGLQSGVLPVQGPPGTGKTYSGARMIRALLRAGKRVGVTGPSHKVISNLLDEICIADRDDQKTTVTGLQVSGEEACADPRIEKIKSSTKARRAVDGRADEGQPPFNLIAGTAWLWSRADALGLVDVLFIDEAGQFSLANALAVAPAAPKLVLLGDPQQLNQPQKGIHPPRTEVSVLEHLTGEDGILTPDQGLFLGVTWRMRPEITTYTSELFYDEQLAPRSDLKRQMVTLADGSTPKGLMCEAVQHEGNSREAREEAKAVVAVFERLLRAGSTFTDRKGEDAGTGGR